MTTSGKSTMPHESDKRAKGEEGERDLGYDYKLRWRTPQRSLGFSQRYFMRIPMLRDPLFGNKMGTLFCYFLKTIITKMPLAQAYMLPVTILHSPKKNIPRTMSMICGPSCTFVRCIAMGKPALDYCLER